MQLLKYRCDPIRHYMKIWLWTERKPCSDESLLNIHLWTPSVSWKNGLWSYPEFHQGCFWLKQKKMSVSILSGKKILHTGIDPRQSVTVPIILSDTDTDTFFRYQISSIPIPILFSGTKFWRYRYRYFFPVPDFADTDTDTFFRYPKCTIPVPIPSIYTKTF